MSWHNGRTNQQVTNLERLLDRVTAVGLKQGRWKLCTTIMLVQRRAQVYTSRYVDARIAVNITAG